MAAYAALRSLMYILHQIKHHPYPPISLDQDQVDPLTENLTFFLKFLEDKPPHSHEVDPLEMDMVDVVHEAEDVIETHIVDQIHVGSTNRGKRIGSTGLYEGLQKVIVEMDAIKEEVIAEKSKKMGGQDQRHTDRSSSFSVPQNVAMVGFDDLFHELIDKLIGQCELQIIPIVGMGGIGKTTLARNLIADPLIKGHFVICAEVAISQNYNTREILRELLYKVTGRRRDSSEYELGEELYQFLLGRRYIIVLDDMWSIEAWGKIRVFFPRDYMNGSRIVVTTRLSELAYQLTDSGPFKMEFLDEKNSWDLFSNTVFGKDRCPVELEEIGKKIVGKCKGLPLSIVVIGGLLGKGKHTHEYWEYIADNLNSVVNSENNGNCLNILDMSYNHLPVHLKPCFLYMGLYPEDRRVRIRILVNLWVAEGFVRPVTGKSLEEAAEDYLQELIDRNLFLSHTSKFHGMQKRCSMHDLVKDFCLRIAAKERFFYVVKQHSLDLVTTQCRRIALSESTTEDRVVDPESPARSLTWDIDGDMPSVNCRLLRVLNTCLKDPEQGGCPPEIIFQLANSRYLAIRSHSGPENIFPACIPWNLHTLLITGECWLEETPLEIWKMPLLRHVVFKKGTFLEDAEGNGIVLENLQTLKTVLNFECDEEMVKRIPNIKRLGIGTIGVEKCSLYHCLLNLERLHKLTTFTCYVAGFVKNVTFPHSLMKLVLHINAAQYWEDILEKVGSLPLLEYLQMAQGCFKGCKWETVQGQFPSLKYLEFGICRLDYWTTEETHFPRLEHLVISDNLGEMEIPSCIGHIYTLKAIRLLKCSYSEALSAKKIQQEQEMEFGNESLKIYAIMRYQEDKERALKSMASPNFEVYVYGIDLYDQVGEASGPRRDSSI